MTRSPISFASMPSSGRCRCSAFTLIELLIVVAIIALLAAIAVPNFLEAQVRASVTRAKADMRTIATAIEMVAVNTGRYPGSLSFSTRYLTSLPQDPFPTMEGSSPGTRNPYRYYNLMEPGVISDPVLRAQADRKAAGWVIFSVGPDLSFYNTPPGQADATVLVFRDYDPTNGTVSLGNVFRTRANPGEFGTEAYFWQIP